MYKLNIKKSIFYEILMFLKGMFFLKYVRIINNNMNLHFCNMKVIKIFILKYSIIFYHVNIPFF